MRPALRSLSSLALRADWYLAGIGKTAGLRSFSGSMSRMWWLISLRGGRVSGRVSGKTSGNSEMISSAVEAEAQTGTRGARGGTGEEEDTGGLGNLSKETILATKSMEALCLRRKLRPRMKSVLSSGATRKV